MRLGLSLRAALVCPVCDATMNASDRTDNAIAIAMFGVSDDPYRVCPRCYRDLAADDETATDEAFRRRVRRYYHAQGIVLALDASGHWQKRSLDS